jgi:hypothetical protein
MMQRTILTMGYEFFSLYPGFFRLSQSGSDTLMADELSHQPSEQGDSLVSIAVQFSAGNPVRRHG